MTKIKVNTKQSKESTALLDNLEQLGILNDSKGFKPSKSHENYLKKSRKKAISYSLASKLADVKDTPLRKSYIRTLYCNDIIYQNGKKATTEYCKSRWCPICNGIRTADHIQGYLHPLLELGNLLFVTLTIKAVEANELKETIAKMNKAIRHIQHNTLRKKHGIKLVGIRKIEVNYNAKTLTFNPHFHIILSTENISDAFTLVDEWLSYFPDTTDRKAQDIRPIDLSDKEDRNHLLELFKYASKTVTKDGFSPEAQDAIYRALFRKRTLQPIGIKKKPIAKREREDLPIDFQPEQAETWFYDYAYKDWLNAKGETLTGYKPNKKTRQLLKNIATPIDKRF